MILRLTDRLPHTIRRRLRDLRDARRARRAARFDDAAARRTDEVPGTGTPPGPAAEAIAEISVSDHAEVWDAVTEARPSYVHKLHESRRRNRLIKAMGSAHPMWAVNSKVQGYRLAASVGVEVPRQLATFDDVTELDPTDLGGRFLVKPVQGSTNRGVVALVARGDDSFEDLMTGRVLTWRTVVRDHRSHVDQGAISGAGVVEELLGAPDGSGAVPDDWKVYVFGGRAVVTMQRRLNGTADRRRWRFRFWTRQWQDLGAVKFVDRLDPTLPRPVHATDLVAAADAVGAELGLPFVRLDFYDTDRGVVFGEVTPHPGPPEVWHPAVDEVLGRHWELAEARATVDRIAEGAWSDLERFR